MQYEAQAMFATKMYEQYFARANEQSNEGMRQIHKYYLNRRREV